MSPLSFETGHVNASIWNPFFKSNFQIYLFVRNNFTHQYTSWPQNTYLFRHWNIHLFKRLFKKQLLWASHVPDTAWKMKALIVDEKDQIICTYRAYYDLLGLWVNWWWETGKFYLFLCTTDVCFPLYLEFLQNLFAKYYKLYEEEKCATEKLERW